LFDSQVVGWSGFNTQIQKQKKGLTFYLLKSYKHLAINQKHFNLAARAT